MEKERVVRSGILDEPMHCPQDVLLRGLAHRVLLVIREDHHIIPLVAEILV